MANPTTNFGWVMPTSTDLVTDLPADFAVFGQGVDTTMAELKGGTSGQILAKASNTDMDFTWVTNDVGDITAVTAGTGLSGGGTSGAVTLSIDTATTVDLSTAQTLTNKTLTSPVLTTPSISNINAKGDLLAGTADNTIAALSVGANNTVLTADSSTATGLKWAAASGGEPAAFWARPASAQSFSSSTSTKVNFGTENLDSDNWFASSTFTPQKAGYYMLTIDLCISGGGAGRNIYRIAKNGSTYLTIIDNTTSDNAIYSATSIVNANGSTDYFEVYVYSTRSSPAIEVNDSAGFQGFFLRS